MRPHVISAVFKRNVAGYFSGVLGYLFLVAFVVAGGFLAFNSRFFADNLATLDQLSERFPLLLLFMIPAVTMTAWADERKLGTDELLFTMPATDLEVLLGKYLAVVGVYTVALLFSTTHAMVLAWIGDPDWGLIATTYLGYWLAGSALIAVGLLASSLASSSTVAFVLGVVLCAVPVFLEFFGDAVAGLVGWMPLIGEPLAGVFRAAGGALSLPAQLADFTTGVVPLSGVLYFVSLAVFALYLNSVVIGRRHWAGQAANGGMGWQYAVRGLSLLLVLFCVNSMISYASARADLTSESIFSLTKTTEQILEDVPSDRPVVIQAFLSPEVPTDYVPVRRELTGLLREIGREGGRKVSVRYVDVEPFSEESEEARKYGIQARPTQYESGDRIQVDDVFLGVHVASGFDEVVIPFFDVGTAAEYQLARAIATVSEEDRRTVGILKTDAKVFGGFDQQTFRNSPPWQLVTELRKQYDVKEVDPSSAIDAEKFDVLVAVMPSTLTEPELENLLAYVRGGGATLVFDDPMPAFNLELSPSRPKPSPGGGGMFGGGNQGPPKADDGRLSELAEVLGVDWNSRQVVFDTFNPHPQFADVIAASLVFITGKADSPNAFNPDNPITDGLQEMIGWFPGQVRSFEAGGRTEVTPLLISSGKTSGVVSVDELTTPTMFGGVTVKPNPRLDPDKSAHVLAAEVRGEGDAAVRAIFVADADIVSDQMFRLQESAQFDLRIDNVTFVMNCIDRLVGDESLIRLRNRRAKFRSLVRVEQAKQRYLDTANAQRTAAEDEADERLEEAQARVDKVQKEIEADDTLDRAAKEQTIANVVAAENRRLAQQEREIERQKRDSLRQIKTDERQAVRGIEGGIRSWALLLPPIPALLLGLFVLGRRYAGEQQSAPPERTVVR